jgi:hypothetical protein
MKRWYANHIIPAHRVLFVTATALLGVTGSYVAQDPHQFNHWLSFVGSAIAMYAAEICNEIDAEAHTLVLAGRQLKGDERFDTLNARNPTGLIALSVLSILMIGSGLSGVDFGWLLDRWGDYQALPLRQANPSPSLVSGTPVG